MTLSDALLLASQTHGNIRLQDLVPEDNFNTPRRQCCGAGGKTGSGGVDNEVQEEQTMTTDEMSQLKAGKKIKRGPEMCLGYTPAMASAPLAVKEHAKGCTTVLNYGRVWEYSWSQIVD
ncbi:hypothetical protein Btru_066488 [Bulinus truncatus]|nr:hypothetical protein Btru_066488 [Bulinus truncatus]